MLKRKCFLPVLIGLVMLAAQSLPAAAEGSSSQSDAIDNSRYFPVTGHNVSGPFLDFFDAHGGLDVFGYPRTEQFVENGRTVQYFQRNRMELWPENPAAFQVQLMLIGDFILGGGDPPLSADQIPAAGDTATRYYAATGHSISGNFLNFFDNHGGVDILGYPTTEAKTDGGRTVQWFQRARLELSDAGLVQLGLLGDEYIFRLGLVPSTAVAAVAPSDGSGAPAQVLVDNAAATGPVPADRIVFQQANGGPIYSVNSDGSGLTQIASGLDPSLSPDGHKLIYANWGYPEGLYTLDLSAAGSSGGLAFGVHQPHAPVFSPDGSKVAYYVRTAGYYFQDNKKRRSDLKPGDFFNIAVLDLATSTVSNPPAQPQHSFTPSWSPDSKKLVFKGDLGLYVTDFSQASPVTTQIPNTDTRFSFPVWSPDGQHIALMYRQNDHYEVGIINPDGSGLQMLTSSPPFTTPANNLAPAWSPDGSKLAFVSDRGGSWHIYTMNADGSGVTKLTDMAVAYDYSMARVVYWGKQ